MRKLLLGLGIFAVFAAGCAAGASSWTISKASAARSAEQRWAYFCFDADSAEDVHTKANAAGARGWEMVTAAPNGAGQIIWCFRQLQP